MSNEQHGRFKDAPWYPKKDEYVLLGGVGGIGSWTGMLLSRAGFKVIAYDDDTVEVHNLGGQLYRSDDIGSSKIVSFRRTCKEFSGVELPYCQESRITEASPTHAYVISAFDNMASRKILFEKWYAVNKANKRKDAIFIDGRLNAEQFWIYCVRASDTDVENYRKTLFNDEDIEEVSCTMKQTSHTAAMIAGHIVGFFTNHMTNVASGENIREVPFSFEYMTAINMTV